MSVKIVILGAGPGGYVAAIRAAQRGAEVTVIEQDQVGGTCLNRGCIPSKVMKTTAEMLERFQRASEFGLTVEGPVVPDMGRLMDRKQKVVQDQVKGILRLLSHHKIRYVRGTGRIAGPDRVQVKGGGADQVDLPWDSLVLALGSEPLPISGLPFDGERVISSTHALNLTEIPGSILIVGGGVIGCEFAFILSSLGSRVTVVEALGRLLPLPSVDEDSSKVLQREMKKRRIKMMLNRTVEGIDENGGRLRVAVGASPSALKSRGRDVRPAAVEVDKVLVCIGRMATTGGIGLETLGIRTDQRGWIMADERMETNIPHVYGIGDVLGPDKIMLAHVASAEGSVAAINATGGNSRMNYGAVPGAIFTMPEVADVGLTEVQAREKGFNVRSDTVLFRTLGKAQVIGEIAGQAKIVSDAGSGGILGVHMIGPHAADLIAEATLAVQTGCSVRDLAKTIHAHPTLSEVMGEAAFRATDMPLHG
ncbi:MAG: dihydrolipoyl dehydrogenase [Deltaproteobacteria bacterium]|nr:dihydrolipoyl dehydrogenase [Deltaproteobacteria bacterium]